MEMKLREFTYLLCRYETPRDIRLVKVVNQHVQHEDHQHVQQQHPQLVHHVQHPQHVPHVQHQTSSDFKFSSDDSFKTIYSSGDNNTQQNNISEPPNVTNSFEIPTDFPTNGFLYNAIWEKKSTYV
jgi:hypothetical protein